MTRSHVLVATLALLTGCANQNDLSNVEHVRVWANAASALAVYANVHSPLSVVEGAETFPDPACPTVVDDGTTATITGDCTNTSGTAYAGSVTIVRTASGGRSMTFDGYGEQSGDETLVVTTGTFTTVELSLTSHTFDADYVREGGTSVTYDYAGSVEGTFATPETLWNGSGTVTRDGPLAPVGSVEATTVDERRNSDVCGGQALSGNTTLMANDRTVVITYDGATDCDAEDDAEWSLDGTAQGSITGISCAVHPRRSSAPLAMLLPLLLVLRLRKRR